MTVWLRPANQKNHRQQHKASNSIAFDENLANLCQDLNPPWRKWIANMAANMATKVVG